MALTFTELLPDRGASETTSGIMDTSRKFMVPGQSPEDALAHPSLRSAPPTGAQLGTLHPRNPSGESLKCSGYRVGDRIGAGSDAGYYVYALYNPPGSGSPGSPPDINNPYYVSFSSGTAMGSIDVPIMARIDNFVQQPPGAGPTYTQPLKGYNWINQGYSHDLPTANFTVTYTSSVWGLNQILLVAAQTNAIHIINGRRWKFRGGDAREAFEANKWSVTYTWESEYDTPQTVWGDWYSGSAWVKSTVAEIPARAAFERWVVTWKTNTGSLPSGYAFQSFLTPEILVRCPSTIITTGYTTLPGYSDRWGPMSP